MRNLLYVGHKFHTLTRSTRFLVDLLENYFKVTIINVDPSSLESWLVDLDFETIDIVVVFQLDFLAPVFLARGVPTIVIPMFDGSENMPPSHWEMLNEARIISFSRRLHSKMKRCQSQSLLVRYFPEVPPTINRSWREMNGFLWERRPDHGIDANLVRRVFDEQLGTLHIHRAPDDKTLTSNLTNPFKSTVVTHSFWLESKEDMLQLLRECNIYFAPRLSEGIGMGFLEAMALGMVVVAPNTSTHDEYIVNWHSGILYPIDISSPPHVDVKIAKRLGDNARDFIFEGRKQWEDKKYEIVQWIEETPKPVFDFDECLVFCDQLPLAYSAGFSNYISHIRRNNKLVKKMSPKLNSWRESFAKSELSSDEVLSATNVLDQLMLQFGTKSTRSFLVSGWSNDEDGYVWINGTSATIRFIAGDILSKCDSLTINCHSIFLESEQTLAIVINGVLAKVSKIQNTDTSVFVSLPEGMLQIKNEIKLYASEFSYASGDSRKLSIAVHSIIFDM
ncbi:glycosyltransferase [uncultured Methylobacterium sp.]|uniref:glycosyltransferase n=1 Tax=uncultured Methylobacterium sp. TaxID=157278 RepID=UPI0035C95065